MIRGYEKQSFFESNLRLKTVPTATGITQEIVGRLFLNNCYKLSTFITLTMALSKLRLQGVHDWTVSAASSLQCVLFLSTTQPCWCPVWTWDLGVKSRRDHFVKPKIIKKNMSCETIGNETPHTIIFDYIFWRALYHELHPTTGS